MKANSNHHPTSFTKSKGKVYFNSNIIESEKTDEYGTRTVYDYDYVEITKENKEEIILAAIVDGNDAEDLTEFEKSDDHNFVDYISKKTE